MPLPLLPVTVLEAAQRHDGSGFCLACGEESSDVEPDARDYRCEDCGATQVYGAEEIIISGML
ncbi:MAG: hypothetical protein Q8S75_15770 [Nitrospirota bacterium]|jgi:Zn finger protein HypA/HybF involved in hydrogenase expression|nr:hypothetical protein [Nitrospirota bacterium]